MAYDKRILKLVLKWSARLAPEEKTYFKDKGVVKDLSLFAALLKANHIEVDDDRALEVVLYKYLQVLMILCTLSDDYRDAALVEDFLHVPFVLEDISKGRFRSSESSLDRNFMKWKGSNLEQLWNIGVRDTLSILGRCPDSHREIVNEILSYYSTPVVALFCVTGVETEDYSFQKELTILLNYVIEKHFPERQSEEDKVEHYIEGMLMVAA